MASIEAFSELLQVLYSPPLQQEQWQRFLTLVSGYTASGNGYFLSADTNSRLALRVGGGEPQDPPALETYNQ
jgi:hypothetical protein